MNLDLIKQKLDALNAGNLKKTNFQEGESIFWKPAAGQTQIRILPNPYNRETPFTELLFYYEFGKTMISPKSFGQQDDTYNVIQKLRKSNDELDRKMAYKIEPKMRTYCMVLVRGLEHEGPKYWGFGKTTYADLLGFCADPDYGDIADLVTGRDVVVDFVPAKGESDFPKTSIRVKPNTSKAFEDPALVEKIKQIKPLEEVWNIPTNDELKEALSVYVGKSTKPVEEKPKNQAEPAPPRQEPGDSDFLDMAKQFEVPKNSSTDAGDATEIPDKILNDIDAMFEKEFGK